MGHESGVVKIKSSISGNQGVEEETEEDFEDLFERFCAVSEEVFV